MKVAFVGATKGMGRSLARRMAERGDALCLLGRDVPDLERSARDLEARGAGRTVAVARCDLLQPDTFEPALAAAEKALAGLDVVVITAALFATQDALESDPALAARVMQANFTNTVLLCEAARKRLLARGGGTLCVFSSVAGERGRKPIVIYGATKAGLSAYLEGLDHKFRRQGLVTVCVKPGFVKTSMTEGLKPPPFAGEPDAVAHQVLRAIDAKKPMVFTPRVWGHVMRVIRALPRGVMRRIEF